MKLTFISIYLLGLALLISTASVSAGSIKVTGPTSAGRAGSAEFAAAEVTAHGPVQMFGCILRVVGKVHSADSFSNGPGSPLSILTFELLQPGGNDDDARDRHRDRDRGPDPVPEPLTALLFGAAVLVGGGILRRRQRKGEK